MKGNNRLLIKLEEISARKDKALVFFLTAGFPDLKTTENTILALERGGADIIELGVPFSDPVADGPTIQFSSQKALETGINLKKILDFTRKLRKKTDIPIILMSYLNPIHAFGLERFFKSAKSSGIDGLLITDIIPEESPLLGNLPGKYGLSHIFLAAPTTSHARQKLIALKSDAFIYAVSLTGVTGEREKVRKNIMPFIKGLKKLTDKPVLVGFGISKPRHAGLLKKYADGVVVGSALIKLLAGTPRNLIVKKVELFARQFRRVLND